MNIIHKLIDRLSSYLPFNWLRCKFFRLRGRTIGGNVWIARGAKVSRNVIVDNNVRICSGSVVGGSVKIGKNVVIGPCARIANCVIGDNSHIEYGVIFTGFQKGHIKIGRNTYIGIHTILDCSGGIEIGNYVHVAGPTVGFWTHSGVLQCLLGKSLEDYSKTITGKIIVDDNVWIGGNTTIYPGVKIGHHVVILPNSVVNSYVPPYRMVGGCPAKIKKEIEISGNGIAFKSPMKGCKE